MKKLIALIALVAGLTGCEYIHHRMSYKKILVNFHGEMPIYYRLVYDQTIITSHGIEHFATYDLKDDSNMRTNFSVRVLVMNGEVRSVTLFREGEMGAGHFKGIIDEARRGGDPSANSMLIFVFSKFIRQIEAGK